MENLQHKIAERAYQHFLDRGARHGNDMSDWLQAEQEIMTASGAKPKKRAATRKRTTTRSKKSN